MVDRDDVLPGMDLHLVEHCNLNCKYCCHFAPLAKKEYLHPRSSEKNLRRLKEVAGDKVSAFKLLGGEPLLHRNLPEIFAVIRKVFPDIWLQVTTNGLLLNSMDSDFWKSMHKHNIILRHSFYPFAPPVDIDAY